MMPQRSTEPRPDAGIAGAAAPVMTRELSLYLDLVRFVAAFLVLVSHSNDRELSARVIPFATYGHSAVVVFFVLSGFVIAWVTATKERTARDYAVSRAARIYSVALPALALTLLLDIVGERLNPGLYAHTTTHDLWLVRLLSSALFMNEFWGISITTFSNVPYWSLNYEVWYYVVFGIFVFWTGPGRYWALALAALMAGPKILLLMPVWLMGVWLYRHLLDRALSVSAGLVLFFGSWVLLVLFHAFDIAQVLFEHLKAFVGADFHRQMTWSRFFLSDYLLGILVALNFAGFRAADKVLGKPLLVISRPVRVAAGFTLSIYLFHKPLLLFFIALVNGDPNSRWFYATVVALTLVTIVALGTVTEHRKDDYRRFFQWAIARAVMILRRWAPTSLPRDSR
jgi:peptidoglycan/LPS O-acetylase OafA/YrhL